MFKKYDVPQRNEKFKKELIKIRGCKCEKCNNTEWLNQPIKLELHHIDGDRSNCELNNLQLLCLNCHSYTDNYCLTQLSKNNLKINDEDFIKALENNCSIRQALLELGISDTGANYKRAHQIIDNYNLNIKPQQRGNKNYNYCIDCGIIITDQAIRCSKCEYIHRITYSIERDELKQLIRNKPFTKIGEQFGVSDNAVRKWCDKYNLPRKASEIKKYSDEEWQKI